MKQISYAQLVQELSFECCREFSVFGALRDETVDLLLREGECFELADNEVLYNEGDPSDCFFVVLSGLLGFYKVHEGSSCLVREFGPGEELGFVGMISLHPRAGWAQMHKAGKVLRVSDALFHTLQQQNGEDFTLMLINLVRDKSRELTSANNKLVELSKTAQ